MTDGICPGSSICYTVFIQVSNRGRNGCIKSWFCQYISLPMKYTVSGSILQYNVGLTLSFFKSLINFPGWSYSTRTVLNSSLRARGLEVYRSVVPRQLRVQYSTVLYSRPFSDRDVQLSTTDNFCRKNGKYSTIKYCISCLPKIHGFWIFSDVLIPSCSRWFHGSGVYLLFLSKYTVKYYNYFLSIFKKMLYY